MLKIGVLGAGHLGKIHINCIQQISDYELVGFYLFAPTCAPTGEVVGEELWAVVGAVVGAGICEICCE